MKKSLFCLAVVMLCCAMFGIGVNAETEGYYTYTVSNGEATITSVDKAISGDVRIPDTLGGYPVIGIGERAFDHCIDLTGIIIPDGVSSIRAYTFAWCERLMNVSIPNSVASIEEHAFYSCSDLRNIVIPNGVTSIAEDAFGFCTNLANVILPTSVTFIGRVAFSHCESLTSIIIPSGVTSIEEGAFDNCANLAEVVISHGVTSIEGYAFERCEKLTNVTIPDSVTSIGEHAFARCESLTSVTIPASVKSIEEYAFYMCDNLAIRGYIGSVAETYAKNNRVPFEVIEEKCGDNLIWTLDRNGVLTISGIGKMNTSSSPWRGYESQIRSAVVSSGVTSIGDYAFYSCSNLTSIFFPEGITFIGSNAFRGCETLSNITIPNSVASIGDRAFEDCSSLISIILPNGITSIGDGAFEDCNNLKSIILPNGITSIGNSTFSSCNNLTNIFLPNSITSIGNYAFSSCDNLTSIFLPDGITFIGKRAFAYSGLEYIILPQNIKSIEPYTFYGCDNISSFVIPSSVRSIGNYAFKDCANLKKVYFCGNIASMGDYAFSMCESLEDVYFYGNVPGKWGLYPFGDVCEEFTIYYSENTSGWTTPRWKDSNKKYYNTVTFNPEDISPTPDPLTVTAVQVSPTSGTISDTYTFTAQAAGTDKVAFYVDTYHLDTVTGVNGVFTFSHGAFTATGDRTVYAYPCDAAGQPIMTEGSYASAAFIIAKAPQLDPVTITSSSYRTSQINTAVDLRWLAPANAPTGTRYNIYVYSGGAQVGTVITTTALACTIPASYFPYEGEYLLEVLPAAAGWESASGRSVTLSVRTAQPTLDDFALDTTTVSLDGSVRLSGFINGNGGLIAKVTVTVLNTDINDGGTIWTNQNLNAPYFDLSAVPALVASNPAFKGAGNYKIRVFIQMQGAEGADMLGNASLSVLTDARLPLATPVVTGSESITAGDSYQLSWIPVANADYYELTIDGSSYKEIIKGNTATISGKTLKNLTGAQTATTLRLRLVAHSNDTDTWLPSSSAVKNITVLPEVQSRAMILSVSMNNYAVVAGSTAEFTVTTTTDVTAIRMKDGAGSFIIDTWNTGYVDKNGERVWTVTQQINDPGVNNQRVLTFYSMIGDTEYNKCDVGFTCVVTAAIGRFDIVSPAHESKQTEHRDLSITWNAPANVAVDSYIVRVYHGDECILQQDVPAQNPAPVVIPGALLLRDNEAYQVRITARKVGHAESTAVSRFTLLCPHDNTYQPVEMTTYTNTGSASLHRFVKTISYTCADCGQKNLEAEPETGTGSHNWVDLDNGGRVCNFCWYMEGVVADPKEYKFIGGSQDRTVYMNVDASGEPYGVQKNEDGVDRQVFETDVITVLGTKGACYLIRYPVGQSGYHFGFMEQELVEKSVIEENPTMILTPNQIYVQNMRNELYKLAEPQEKVLELFVNEYGLAQSYSDYWCENYSWGDQIERNIFSGKGLIMNNLKRLIQNNDYISDINYEVLNSIICKIPSVRNNEWDNLVLQYEKYLNESSDNAEKLQFIIDFTDTADDLLHFNDFAIYADTEEKITKRIAQLEASGFAKDHNFNLVKGSKWDEAIDSAKNVSAKYLLEVLRAYNNYYNFSMNAELEYFDVLREICYGDQSLQQTITMLEAEYLEEKTAAMNNLKKYLSNVLPDVGLEALLGQFFGAAFTKINVIVAGVEIFIDILASTTGLDAAVNAKEIVAFYSWMVYRTKYDIGNMLKNYDGSAESADKIATYYQVYRGMQIYFIEQVICILEAEDNEFDATIDGDKVAQLQREIQWLLLHDITDWAYNPYNFGGELGGIPNVSDLTSNYYMNILLNGYSYSNLNAFDGIMENWLQMVCADQEKVARMIELMKDFNKSEVNKMYLLHFVTEDQNGNIVKNVNENTSMYHQFEYYSVLYVNKAGIGLYITRPFLHMDPLGKTKAPGYTTCYTFLSASKVEQLLDANTPDQRLLFCVDNTAYGEIANFINWKYTSYVAEAIEFNITQAQYYNSLNLLLGEKYCKYSIECIELDDLVAATFNLKMDFWKDFHLWWSFEDLVKKAGTGRIFTTKYKR